MVSPALPATFGGPRGSCDSAGWGYAGVMKRSLGLALFALLIPITASAFAGTHFFFPAQPVIYSIEGYLDHAPDGAAIEAQVKVGAGGHNRALLITAYRRLGSGDPWALTRDLGMYEPDFILQGPSEAITRILEAPAGSRVSGTFQFLRSFHSLLINPYDLKVE